MARRGLLPDWFGHVARRTRTPLRATLAAGGATFLCAVALPFADLVSASSSLTLIVFLLVNLALWRLHRAAPAEVRARDHFRAPRWVPPMAALMCLGLLASEAFGRWFG
jgi:amino acid transporter